MSRAVIYEHFGGPEVLEVREVPEPHAAPGQIRIRITAAGLNPMDWGIAASAEAAARFGVVLPSGFGADYAGVVDEVGAGVVGYAVGQRVFGGAMAKAVADHAVISATPSALETAIPTPDGIEDAVAAAIPTPGLTASAALSAIRLTRGDTVLVGGAAGGVGVLAVQLARLAGARVIGTASPDTADFLRTLGVEPVAYGAGLADRVRALAPAGITAAADLFGTEAAVAALQLGVGPERISTIAAGPNPPGGVRSTGALLATAADLERLTVAIASGDVTVPIAATFPLDRVRDAVSLQAARHVHGRVVVIP